MQFQLINIFSFTAYNYIRAQYLNYNIANIQHRENNGTSMLISKQRIRRKLYVIHDLSLLDMFMEKYAI